MEHYLSYVETLEMPILWYPVCTISLFHTFKLVLINTHVIFKAVFIPKHMLVRTGQIACIIAQIRKLKFWHGSELFKVVHVSDLELNEDRVSSWVPMSLFRVISHKIGLILYPLLGLHRVYFLYLIKSNLIQGRLCFLYDKTNASERPWALPLAFVWLTVWYVSTSWGSGFLFSQFSCLAWEGCALLTKGSWTALLVFWLFNELRHSHLFSLIFFL